MVLKRVGHVSMVNVTTQCQQQYPFQFGFEKVKFTYMLDGKTGESRAPHIKN